VEQIRGVIEQSVRGLDRVDRAMILGAYLAGAVEEHDHFTGTVEAFAEFVCGDRSTRFAGSTHLIGMPAIELRGDTAFSTTSCVVHRIAGTSSTGQQDRHDFVSGVRFLDKLERPGGGWRIAHRICLGDWAYTVPVAPGLLAEGDARLSGRRDGTDPWYGWSAEFSGWGQ
jgi:hypothetical protein